MGTLECVDSTQLEKIKCFLIAGLFSCNFGDLYTDSPILGVGALSIQSCLPSLGRGRCWVTRLSLSVEKVVLQPCQNFRQRITHSLLLVLTIGIVTVCGMHNENFPSHQPHELACWGSLSVRLTSGLQIMCKLMHLGLA